VQRLPLPAAPDGSECVEVVNKAAIRVLAWKIWTSNRVVYKIALTQGAAHAASQLPQCACSSQQAAPQEGSSSSSSNSSSSSSNMQEVPRTVSFNLLSSVRIVQQTVSSLSGTSK
jgi:hypothetical protein